jgi:dipeptidyl aminopeptidase/acylaminoacyl peptidase
MKTARWISLSLVLGGCSQLSQSPSASHGVALFDAKTFYDTVGVSGASLSSDEAQALYSSDASGVFNVYSQDLRGGAPVRLTSSPTQATYAIGYFPKDNRVLYTADQGGNELNHIYVRNLDGKAEDLTPGTNLKAQFNGWAADDTGFYSTTNERDSRYFDLYKTNIGAGENYARSLLYKNDQNFGIGQVSLDGRWLTVTKSINNADNDIYLADLADAAAVPKKITPHEGNAIHSPEAFAADSKSLVYLSDRDSEYQRAWRYDLATGKSEVIETRPWDITSITYSRDGKKRAMAVNADGATQVSIVDTATGKGPKAEVLDRGQVRSLAFSRSGKKVVFTSTADTSPADVYVMDTESGQCTRLTKNLNPAIDESMLVSSEVVRFPSFDRLEIPAILYKPAAASKTNKAPAVLWIHGGPGGQTVVGYSADIQFLVNHGYAVLGVNNRGSSGYGKTFNHLDDHRHGDVDLKDCVWGRKYLETLDWIDPKKIGIVGGSYGGYMVAAALAFEPEAFEAGIDIFGVTNWVRTLKSIPAWWEQQRQSLYAELGDPAVEEAALHDKSPLFFADRIRRPLLVVQGKNDPRVLEVESREIVEAVKKNGVPCEYLLFDDEGHGFRNKKNRIAAAEAYVKFLDRYLRGVK